MVLMDLDISSENRGSDLPTSQSWLSPFPVLTLLAFAHLAEASWFLFVKSYQHCVSDRDGVREQTPGLDNIRL
jgi:hypothetical protein